MDKFPSNPNQLINRPVNVHSSKIVPGLNEPMDHSVDIAPVLLEKFAGMELIQYSDVGHEFWIDSNGFKIRDLKYKIDEIFTDDGRGSTAQSIGVFNELPKKGRINGIADSDKYQSYNVEVEIDKVIYIIDPGPSTWEPVWGITIHGRTISGRFEENYNDEVRNQCFGPYSPGTSVEEVVVDNISI